MSFSSGSGAPVRSSSAPPLPPLLYQFFKECLNFPVLFFLNLERLFTPRIRKECNNIISDKSLPALHSPSSSASRLAVTQGSPARPYHGSPARLHRVVIAWLQSSGWGLRFWGFWGIYQRQVTLPQAKRSSEKGKGISIAGADLGCPGMSGFSTEALAGIILDTRAQR